MARVPRVQRIIPQAARSVVSQPANGFANALAPVVGAVDQFAQEENAKVQARANQKVEIDFLKAASAYEAGLGQMEVPEGGAGYVQMAKGVFDESFGKLKESVPAHMQDAVSSRIDRTALQLGDAALRAQNSEAEAFSKFELEQGLDGITAEAARNPTAIAALKKKASELIANNPDLSASERRKLQDVVGGQLDETSEIARVKADPLAASTYAGTVRADALIKDYEGYSDTPYWDVNAQRAGYGSDTTTLADGTVVKITKGMTVTRADSERDLQRRIGEFQKVAIKNVGKDAWAKLPQNVKAALTSITYNYGEIPDRIRSAVKSGDVYAIAEAVEGLAGDNNGINAKRRAREADVIRGGNGGLSGASYGRVQSAARSILAAEAKAEAAKVSISAIELARSVDAGTATEEDIWEALENGDITQSKGESLLLKHDKVLRDQSETTAVLEDTLRRMQEGFEFNPLSTDDRKSVNDLADAVIENLEDEDQIVDALSGIAVETGVAPKSLVESLSNDIAKGDVAALSKASQIQQMQPRAFAGPGGSAIQKAVKGFDEQTSVGVTAEDAAKALKAAEDKPLSVSEAEKAAKKELRDIGPEDVNHLIGEAFETILPFDQKEMVPTMAAQAYGEFSLLYEKARASGMDAASAQAAAIKGLTDPKIGLYGVSSMSSGRLKQVTRGRAALASVEEVVTTDKGIMRHPPEMYYPMIDGSHEYLQADIQESLKGVDGYEGGDWFIMPDSATENAVKRSRAGSSELPSYAVYYTDANGAFQVAPMAWGFSPEQVAAAQKKVTNRQKRDFEAQRAKRIESKIFEEGLRQNGGAFR